MIRAQFDTGVNCVLRGSLTLRKPIPPNIKFRYNSTNTSVLIDIHGQTANPADIKKVNAVAIAKEVYLNGISGTNPDLLYANSANVSGARASCGSGAFIPDFPLGTIHWHKQWFEVHG